MPRGHGQSHPGRRICPVVVVVLEVVLDMVRFVVVVVDRVLYHCFTSKIPKFQNEQ